MKMAQSIDDIRNIRDTALAAFDSSIEVLGSKIAQTTTTGPFLDQLTARFDDLMSERNSILAAATEAVLQLPEVVAAADTLNSLANKMKTAAQALPRATNILTRSSSVLALGQQFADTLATARQA
jgi:hypothetical protein